MSDNARCQAHITSMRMVQRMANRALDREFTPAQLSFNAGDSRSHAIYLAGHMAWAIDAMTGRLLGVKCVMPKEHHDIFCMSIEPNPDPAKYPSMQETLKHFNAAVDNICAAVEKLTDADLDKPVPEGGPASKMFPNYGAALHGTFFHTSYHLGQVTLLMRAQGMGSAFGM